MLVILGEHNLQVFEHTEHLMHVETVVTHPNYNEETLDYDIMLVKLAQPVQRDANVQPVALPTACAMAGTSCVMSGWGNTLSNGSESPPPCPRSLGGSVLGDPIIHLLGGWVCAGGLGQDGSGGGGAVIPASVSVGGCPALASGSRSLPKAANSCRHVCTCPGAPGPCAGGPGRHSPGHR